MNDLAQSGVVKAAPAYQIDVEEIRAEADAMLSSSVRGGATIVFEQILDRLERVDFRELADLDTSDNLTSRHYRVLAVQEVLKTARQLNCGLCRNQDFIYGYNGEFWQLIDRDALENFLGEAAKKLGVNPILASDYEFKTKLAKQFMADAYLPKPPASHSEVLINLKNGTFEISGGLQRLRAFSEADFMTYQLPFDFDKDAESPKWQTFLDRVLPDISKQLVLAEFIGYIFLRDLKLEKTLLLFGTGANGKSVVFDVMNALLGKENVTNFSLESLCHEYYRAKIGNALLNYSSDISNRLQAEKFKLLTSGEPIEARLPYGQPMILTDYARLAFNCNELPKDVEHSEAYFRRFLIIHFDQYIAAECRNPLLAKEIIASELSGVFNWVLAGLRRLLQNGNFSPCSAAIESLENYRRESDSVAMFIADERYQPSASLSVTVKEIYAEYKTYCTDNGYRPLGRNKFVKRLELSGIPRVDSYQPFFRMERRIKNVHTDP